MKIQKLIPLLFICVSLFSTSCNYEPPKVAGLPSEEPEPEPEPVEEEEEEPPPKRSVYLEVSMQWQGDTSENYTPVGTCELLSDDNQVDKVCNVAVPEAQLYYSRIRFRIGSDNSVQCPILSFIPYHYQRSKAEDYVPPGTTEEQDCSPTNTNPLSPLCYGGAAPSLIPEFPVNKGQYFLTAIMPFYDYKLEPSNEIRWYGLDRVNYMLTNDLSAARRSVEVLTGANQRVPDDPPNDYYSFVDYTVLCEDIYGEDLVKLQLTISDINQPNNNNGVLDQYKDWD